MINDLGLLNAVQKKSENIDSTCLWFLEAI